MTLRRDLYGQVLRGPCFEWPGCSCGTKWAHWSRYDDAGLPHLSPDDLDGVRLQLVCMLSCVAEHCPDKRLRQHARVQLLHPIWEEAFADD